MSGSGCSQLPAILLFLILLAFIVEVMVVPNVIDYTSFFAKIGGCGSSAHTPWYARKDGKYNLTELGDDLVVTLEYSDTDKATVTFDLQPVLTMIGKEKFKAEDVTGGALVADNKVRVTVTSDATKDVDATATVKLEHSTLLLTVTGSTGFVVDAAVPATAADATAATPAALSDTPAGAVIEYFVDLKLGESDNTVSILVGASDDTE